MEEYPKRQKQQNKQGLNDIKLIIMETLYCAKCDTQSEYYTELKSNQNVARCSVCDTFIKNIPYEKPMLYVGKYAKKPIEELTDLSYLQWAEKNMKLNTRTKEAIRSRITQLEFLSK